MKKIMALIMSAILLGGCFAACTDGSGSGTGEDEKPTDTTPSTSSDAIIEDRESIDYAFNNIFTNGEVADSANGFSSASDVTGARFMVNGAYQSEMKDFSSRMDAKLELYKDQKLRFVNVSAGMAFTLSMPETPTVDYSIAKYRVQFTYGDTVLSYSAESSNPYTSNTDPWGVYRDEWLLRWINNDQFINNNGLTRTSEVVYADTEMKPGYEVYMYSVKIDDDENVIERPYYNVAVIRETDDVVNFALFVMKSKSDKTEEMKSIVASYSKFNSRGITRNYYDAGEPMENTNWNAATKEYFEMLQNSDKVNWGVFSYSMPGSEDSLTPGTSGYDSMLTRSKNMQNAVEEAWDYKYDIYPTYTHLTGYFPLAMANELAGGDGKNGKPVLQFTYQFTTNNNLVAQNITPMFDILRGDYEEHFRQLAKDIKAYGQPVLFRLNNEMNTDWTSYCGMVTLLDPDIFVMTWRYLYDIFEEEGVDNCIWIWNPLATSCPYSSWGEDLCYNPGKEYLQLIGATSYEMNNGVGATKEERASGLKSFEEHYSSLYEKNKAAWSQYSVIISEFACGSGGDYYGPLGRNADLQAEWVTAMFEEMNATDKKDYIKQIKGAVWFNCNDYNSNSQINNRLRFIDPDGWNNESYDDLAATVEAFRKGLNP